jgi:hypothetical protein
MDKKLKVGICKVVCRDESDCEITCCEWETCGVHGELEQAFKDAGWVKKVEPAEGELVTLEEISRFTMSPNWPDVLGGQARDKAVAKAQLAHMIQQGYRKLPSKGKQVKLDIWSFEPMISASDFGKPGEEGTLYFIPR